MTYLFLIILGIIVAGRCFGSPPVATHHPIERTNLATDPCATSRIGRIVVAILWDDAGRRRSRRQGGRNPLPGMRQPSAASLDYSANGSPAESEQLRLH